MFAIYAAVSLVHVQMKIKDKQAQLQEISTQVEQQSVTNEAMRQSIAQGASDAEIAAVAREQLGYGYPGERRFIDASSKWNGRAMCAIKK